MKLALSSYNLATSSFSDQLSSSRVNHILWRSITWYQIESMDIFPCRFFVILNRFCASFYPLKIVGTILKQPGLNICRVSDKFSLKHISLKGRALIPSNIFITGSVVRVLPSLNSWHESHMAGVKHFCTFTLSRDLITSCSLAWLAHISVNLFAGISFKAERIQYVLGGLGHVE